MAGRAVTLGLTFLWCLKLAAASDEACAAGDAGCARKPDQEDNLLVQLPPFRRWAGQLRDKVVGVVHPSNGTEPQDAAACNGGSVMRRRRYWDMCACRRRGSVAAGASESQLPSEDVGRGWRCEGNSMVNKEPPTGACDACLCVFDIDRTLTGKQEKTQECPRNRVVDPPVIDYGYGSGKATLSALAAEGINTTFCGQCHLGITSAGHGSGEGSPWNTYILDHVMRGPVHDAFVAAHPESKRWSHGTDVHSPYVLGQGNRRKQEAVELVRQWFAAPGREVCIRPSSVYFFGDRTENIEPFRSMGLNSREISCGSRDPDLYHGTGMVGYCGARPEEIRREAGNILCR